MYTYFLQSAFVSFAFAALRRNELRRDIRFTNAPLRLAKANHAVANGGPRPMMMRTISTLSHYDRIEQWDAIAFGARTRLAHMRGGGATFGLLPTAMTQKMPPIQSNQDRLRMCWLFY